MSVVSVSRRTDVPAFYARWFVHRVRAGFCDWVNPFGGQVQRVSLLPEHVVAFVFWTRNPAPLMPFLDELEQGGYRFYFHFTLNGYPRALEAKNPPVELSIQRFRALADRIGPDRVFWRYDPIVLGRMDGLALDADYHRRRFEELARALHGYTQRCYFSFVNLYRKARRNLSQAGLEPGVAGAQAPEDLTGLQAEARRRLAADLASVGAAHGITLYACCDDALVGAGGVKKARCVDPEMIARLRPDLMISLKPRPTRDQCGCVESVDIGAYDTCLFGCAYCYATRSRAVALARYQAHRPDATLLWPPAAPQRGRAAAGKATRRR